MSKTIAKRVGLTIAWLAEQGLLSIKTLWEHLAPIRRTAYRLPRTRALQWCGVGRAVSDGGPYPIYPLPGGMSFGVSGRLKQSAR